MDIEAARTFIEIVKTGSFVAAATNLNVTQTAVSARVRVLETVLQRPLFVRNKAGARLTPAGEQFLRFATTLVQVWERARHAVALPPGRETIVTVGAELSLWNPLLRHVLLWMRKQCPEFAVRAEISSAHELMSSVQDGSLDVAVLYAAPRRPGVISELLFREKLVLARTTPTKTRLRSEQHVFVDWGGDFTSTYEAAFPDHPNAVVSVNYGPLALDYILANGGSGYFRRSFIQPFLEEGRMALVPNTPEFEYSAYAVHSTQVDEGVMNRVRSGLRFAAAIAQRPDIGSPNRVDRRGPAA